MDLPAHVLWTYAVKNVAFPATIKDFGILSTLIFSALPDIIESAPFVAYLLFKGGVWRLAGVRRLIVYAFDISHTNQRELEEKFPWVTKLSFSVHSFFTYLIVAVGFWFFVPVLFLPFLFGWGLHIVIDLFLHNDFFSARPFYPFSVIRVKGFTTWYKNKKFVMYNYAFLVLIYLLLFLK